MSNVKIEIKVIKILILSKKEFQFNVIKWYIFSISFFFFYINPPQRLSDSLSFLYSRIICSQYLLPQLMQIYMSVIEVRFGER